MWQGQAGLCSADPGSVFLSATGSVLCARWCQLGNLKGSCRERGFTAAASQKYLSLLPHRCPQARAEQVGAAGVGKTLPGSERSSCHTAVAAACARLRHMALLAP